MVRVQTYEVGVWRMAVELEAPPTWSRRGGRTAATLRVLKAASGTSQTGIDRAV
jgi:hypothetical protein